MLPALIDAVDRDGFVTLPAVFSPDEALEKIDALTAAIASASPDDPAILGEPGSVYGVRNILALWPPAVDLWMREALLSPLRALLGPRLGLVRGLYFDKPPGNSWALPWHKDLTIAVRDNTLPAATHLHPTRKAGVPHIEAPESVLATMLTARIHLDPVNELNGPLKVVPGSHRDGKVLRLEDSPIQTLLANAGDVLLIRPLVAHCSNHSHPQSSQHRRILHLEFASSPELPDGFVWHDFIGARG